MGILFLKNIPARILFFIFIANFFYDDPSLYFYKRIVYIIFIGLATINLWQFYNETLKSEQYIANPSYYRYLLLFLFLIVVSMLIQDLLNPSLSFVTLIQNPYAVLCIVPLFLFFVGSNCENESAFYQMLLAVAAVFIALFTLPLAGKLKYYQGYIASIVVLPIFIFAIHLKKHIAFAVFLIAVSFYFSYISEYRIIAFRVLVFFALFVSLNLVRRFGPLKFTTIAVFGFTLFQFIYNLEDVLFLFKNIIGVRGFDDDDTRAFLWEEFFADLTPIQVVFGKGFLGTYFSPYFMDLLVRLGDFSDHYDRFLIEVGFLHLILKGGIILYLIYVWSPLYAFVRGIFGRHNDWFAFNMSIYLLTELFLMFIENIPYYSFQFSLLFFFSGLVYRRIVLYGDEAVMEQNIIQANDRAVIA